MAHTNSSWHIWFTHVAYDLYTFKRALYGWQMVSSWDAAACNVCKLIILQHEIKIEMMKGMSMTKHCVLLHSICTSIHVYIYIYIYI